MALIRSLEQGLQQHRPPKSEVDCSYVVWDDPEYGRLLKLTTFGSDYRKSGPKSSQVIELNEEVAAKLFDVLRSAFPGII
jgi:hypothetical protein